MTHDRTPRMAVHSCETDHYENFPVASLLCPAHLRPAIGAIYAFARTADDLADEGDASPEQRLADLRAFRADLLICANADGRAASTKWPQVFARLGSTIREFALPLNLLLDLLSAFEQDVTQHSYLDRAELLDYCRRSANPVGRLLMHLYGVHDERLLTQSDAICTALQLANFWQDLSLDIPRKRFYVPLEDCERVGLAFDRIAQQHDSPVMRQLVASLVDWSRDVMNQGADLPHGLSAQVGWRVGMELRWVVKGGLAILDKIEAIEFDSLRRRPRLGGLDIARIVWGAAWMKPASMITLAGRA